MPTWDEICNPVPNNWGREGAKGFIIFQLTSSYSFGTRLINRVPMFTYDSHYLKWTPIYQPSKIPLIRPVNGQPAAPINDANPPPGNQPLLLRLCDGKTALTRFRPNKMPQMQAALTQPYAITTPQQDFDTINWRVAKCKGRSSAGLLP